MAQTHVGWDQDAIAESYWSKRERQNAARREYLSRPLCCHCKTRPVENKKDSVLCKTDADYYRREFGQEP